MLEASQDYKEQKKVDRILYNFRHQKRASRADTRNLEDRLISEWNPDCKISKEDYSSILKQNAKYLVDYVTDDISDKVGKHLLTEVGRLYDIGLTKNQISRAIRKNKAETIENIVKKEEWPIAIGAIYSKNAKLKASKLRKNYEEIRNYLESKTDWRTAKTIAGRAKTKETAEKYLQKYQEITEHLKNLGYKTKIKTIASQAFTAKDHIKKAEGLAQKYDKYLNSFFEANAFYKNGKMIGWANAIENLNLRKEKSKVNGNIYQDVRIEEFDSKDPVFRVREEIKNEGFEPNKGTVTDRNKNFFKMFKERITNLVESIKLKTILKKYGYSDIEKEIIQRKLNNNEKSYSIERDLEYFRESKNFAKRYVDEATAGNIAAAVLRMQPSSSIDIDKRLPEMRIEKTNLPVIAGKHIRDTFEGIVTYKELMKYCEERNKEIGKNIAFYSLKASKSLDSERLKQAADSCFGNYDIFLNHFKSKNYEESTAKRIAYYLCNKRFNEEKTKEYEQIFLKTKEKVKKRISGIDENFADYVASNVFSKNFDEENAESKSVHFRNVQNLEEKQGEREYERKFSISEKVIEEAIEKYRPQFEKYKIQKMYSQSAETDISEAAYRILSAAINSLNSQTNNLEAGINGLSEETRKMNAELNEFNEEKRKGIESLDNNINSLKKLADDSYKSWDENLENMKKRLEAEFTWLIPCDPIEALDNQINETNDAIDKTFKAADENLEKMKKRLETTPTSTQLIPYNPKLGLSF